MTYFELTKYPFLDSVYKKNLSVLKNYLFFNIFKDLNRGEKILQTEDEVVGYLSLYTVHHAAKLDDALNSLPKNIFKGKKIEIIDWGCGQGLATLLLLEYLKNMNYNINNCISIHLIEPSNISIKKANRLVRDFLRNIQIIPQINLINQHFDSLVKNDFKLCNDTLKIHLFSNVLDLNNYDLDNLVSTISKIINGFNLFICVGAYYSRNSVNSHLFIKNLSRNFKLDFLLNKICDIQAYYYKYISNRFIVGTVTSSEIVFSITN